MKLMVHGHRGRLGSEIVKQASGDSRLELVSSSSAADVVIDATSPSGTVEILRQCRAMQTPLVIATTGHQEKQLEAIDEASNHLPLLKAGNLTRGIHWMKESLLLLFQTGESGHIDIIESHHLAKKDAPSGTSLELKQEIERAAPGAVVTLHSIRQPEMIGSHRLVITAGRERIELSHSALSREAYAQGALDAAYFLLNRPPGLYTLKDLYASHSS